MTSYQLEHTPGVNNTLTFGKYKGKTILQVIKEKPAYIVWCVRNIKNFNIDNTLAKELCRQYDEHFWKYSLSKYNDNIRILMDKPYNMHATEAMDYLEYDTPEHW